MGISLRFLGHLGVLAVCVVVFLEDRPALAGGDCPCVGDIVGRFEFDENNRLCWTPPNGLINVDDQIAIIRYQDGRGPFAFCDGTDLKESVDLNCDGVVSQCDRDIALCIFRGHPDDPFATCCEPAICGACCIGGVACAHQSEQLCDAAGGTYFGDGSLCDVQNAGIFDEGGGIVFTHVIGPPSDCTGDRRASSASQAGCGTGPFIDAWISQADESMCHNFGVAGSPAIPADFFGPGSDPFTGSVCLQGVPLGDPQFPAADTLIERPFDPFDRCELPSEAAVNVPIEIVALSLASIAPITVTFNGGQDPEEWDVAVGLSDVTASTGTLTASKQHCNGGTYTNNIDVQPKFTFSKVGEPATTATLDTGAEGIGPVLLSQSIAVPWVADIDPSVVYDGDLCSSFHPGIFPAVGVAASCDCNDNQVRDLCDIEDGLEPDTNNNGVPDPCEGILPTVPAASQWGLLVLTLFLIAAGTVIIRRRPFAGGA